ncbi:MAG: hypothetical protein IKA19_08100 [Muribaculaceae bacterium]|nr:hypothetical protein [Muribaculaceae bacterium]MBR1964638.1 hypothetical protein [Muribaculaceae bacterium]
MNSILITPHVINTINSLPDEERTAIANTLAAELILGEKPEDSLSPMQEMIYSIIRFYVKQDTIKYTMALRQVEL